MSGNFDKSIIDKVWSKGIIVKGYDEALFRKDCKRPKTDLVI